MVLAGAACGAAGGALADYVGARLGGASASRRSLLLAACCGALAGAVVGRHSHPGWHGLLLPVWLWGWMAAADADLRSQELYDAHTLGLLAVAVLAGIADRQGMVAAAGALAVGGIWLVIRGGLSWWTWRSSAALAALGVVASGAGIVRLGVLRHWAASGPVDQAAVAHQWASALMLAVSGACAVVVSPTLGWLGSISRRVTSADERVGGADVILWAAMGAWYGLRWVWPVLGVSVVALGVAASLLRAAARWGAWRAPWGEAGVPVVPVLFAVLVAAA